ncbi:nucleoporin nup189-like [Amphibalanus amphitrite]|uniref:nucleoporin nup189-like n=1 Tax=Amphibalanus amphitrite TaxID=1232801 RepID=UPI001C927A56|nr:nucleoporin nup189-like [Amphibalanus amphitrite]
MKVAVVVFCLALVATASAQSFGSRRFLRRPVGGATGFGNAGSTQGQSSGLFGGTSQIQNSFANAGGSAFGGGASFNRANSNVGQSTGLFGNRQFANNQATSNQFGG